MAAAPQLISQVTAQQPRMSPAMSAGDYSMFAPPAAPQKQAPASAALQPGISGTPGTNTGSAGDASTGLLGTPGFKTGSAGDASTGLFGTPGVNTGSAGDASLPQGTPGVETGVAGNPFFTPSGQGMSAPSNKNGSGIFTL